MHHLYLLIGSVTLLIVSILTTFVFCFWSVYLLDAIHRKWKFYKNELRCLQQGTVDVQQQTLAYNAKTELVKNIFLFFLNLTEWLAFIIARIRYVVYFAHELSHEKQTDSQSFNAYSFVNTINIKTEKIKMNQNTALYSFFFLRNIFFVFGLIIVACLCMYLAARIARKSWITSNLIPHLIIFFLGCSVIDQVLASFCFSKLIADWFTVVLVAASLCISFTQYRKLEMVIDWTIVDLSLFDVRSMKKQVKKKEIFTTMFTFIWVGVFLLSFSQLLDTILHTLFLAFREKNDSFLDINLCEISDFVYPAFNYIFRALLDVEFVMELIGNIFIFIPYGLHGLLKMYLIMWRFCGGKTGYRTHFRYGVNTSLISDKEFIIY